MKVEVLYFKGCPNHESAVAQVWKAVSEEHVSAGVEEVEVRDATMAQEIGFLGSPTIRVNGLDIEEGARTAVGFGFGCRTYLAAGHTGTAGLQWRMDRQSFCSGAIPPLLSRTHSGCPGPCRPAHLSNLARLRARWELLDSGFSKTPQDRIYSRNVACPCGVRLSLPRSFFLLIIQIQTGCS